MQSPEFTTDTMYATLAELQAKGADDEVLHEYVKGIRDSYHLVLGVDAIEMRARTHLIDAGIDLAAVHDADSARDKQDLANVATGHVSLAIRETEQVMSLSASWPGTPADQIAHGLVYSTYSLYGRALTLHAVLDQPRNAELANDEASSADQAYRRAFASIQYLPNDRQTSARLELAALAARNAPFLPADQRRAAGEFWQGQMEAAARRLGRNAMRIISTLPHADAAELARSGAFRGRSTDLSVGAAIMSVLARP